MKKLFNKTVSITDTTQIGLPHGKSYKLPTPQFWRNVGDGLMLVAALIPIVGAVVTVPPVVIAIGAGSALIGKYITNCFSKK